MEDPESSNFQLFRECISTPLIEKSVTKPEKKTRKGRRKTGVKPVIPVEEPDDAEELAEFIDYIAHEIFTNLPSDLGTLNYSTWLNTPSLGVGGERYVEGEMRGWEGEVDGAGFCLLF